MSSLDLNTDERIEIVERIVAKKAGISVQELFSHDRHQDFVTARHIVWAILRWHMGHSPTDIARRYKRDHTTVLSGTEKHGDVHGINTKIANMLLAEVEAETGSLQPTGDKLCKTPENGSTTVEQPVNSEGENSAGKQETLL